MPCKMCQERGKTWEGSYPKCAFQGSFLSDNWNCATANAVRDIVDVWSEKQRDLTFARRYDDQCGAYISVAHIKLESTQADGLFVGWYKDRGRTESMWLLGDFGQPTAPTEGDCRAIIAAFSQPSLSPEKGE